VETDRDDPLGLCGDRRITELMSDGDGKILRGCRAGAENGGERHSKQFQGPALLLQRVP
jgi:hypothetical protein